MGNDMLKLGKQLVSDNLIKTEFRESKSVLLESLSSCKSCPIKDYCSITGLMKEKDRKNGCREIKTLYKENFNSWGAPLTKLKMMLAELDMLILQQKVIDADKQVTMSKRMSMLIDKKMKLMMLWLKYNPPTAVEKKQLGNIIEMDYEELDEEVQNAVQGTQNEEGRESGSEA